MKKFEIENKQPSFLPDGDWVLVWADEFDKGELDKTKWDFRTTMMGKKCKHWVKDEGIEFDNDNIIFKIVKKDGVYCTSQIQTGYNFMDNPAQEFDALSNENKKSNYDTVQYFSWPIGEIKEPKFMYKYGYYECRCKMQEKDGWWSAFWLQSPVIGSTMNPEKSGVEVDIMEKGFCGDNIIQHNNHWNGYGSQHKSTGAKNIELTDGGFHRIGLEWTKDYYRYYVDGVLTWEVKAPYPVSGIEQFILLSAEAVGYRSSTWNDWENTENAYKNGDKFIVDYIRVFDRKEK